MSETPSGHPLVKLTLLGVGSLALYVALFYFEKSVLHYSTQGHWYFIIPVTIAFIFSSIHGAFTHEFWDYLGIKPKSSQKK